MLVHPELFVYAKGAGATRQRERERYCNTRIQVKLPLRSCGHKRFFFCFFLFQISIFFPFFRFSVEKNSFGQTIYSQLKITNHQHYISLRRAFDCHSNANTKYSSTKIFFFYETNKFGIPLSGKWPISHVSTYLCLSLVFCHSAFF